MEEFNMSENKRHEKIEKILEKIKKLLALAGNNPSEEEAKAASLKAQKLMNEYNLTLADCDNDKKLEITDSKFNCGGDNKWKFELSMVIADNFRCKVYWLGKKIAVFYGYKTDCEIAKEVFGFLFNICKKRITQVADKAYNETGSSRGVRYSYTKGFVAGIKEVLDAQCTALMIVTPKEVTESYEVMAKDFKNFEVKRSDGKKFSKEHYEQGIRDGRDSMNSRALEA